MAFNRGEWSELYTIFYLLVHRNLKIVNSDLKLITDRVFRVESILTEEKEGFIEFQIDDEIVRPIVLGTEVDVIKVKEVDKIKRYI